MSLTPRQKAILRSVRHSGTVRIAAVAAELRVAPMTVRRDLAVLAAAGLVERIHGGAALPPPTEDLASMIIPGPRAVQPVRSSPLSFGLMVPSEMQQHHEVIGGAEAFTKSIGARLTVAVSYYDPDRDRAEVERLVGNRIDGLLLTPSTSLLSDMDDLRWFAEIPVPTVIVERRPELVTGLDLVDCVTSDHEHGTLLAIRHLVELGHRRIGLLSSDTPTTPWLVRALDLARAAFGLPADVPQVIDHPRGDLDSVDAFLDAAADSGVTAVLAHPDPQAALLLQRTIQRGRLVPDDLAIIAYDDVLAALSDVPMTAVAPHRREVGRLAAARLASRIREGDSAPPHRIMITPRLNLRDSTAPREQPCTSTEAG